MLFTDCSFRVVRRTFYTNTPLLHNLCCGENSDSLTFTKLDEVGLSGCTVSRYVQVQVPEGQSQVVVLGQGGRHVQDPAAGPATTGHY